MSHFSAPEHPHKGHTCVYLGEGLARYGFGHNHPFSPKRHQAFEQALRQWLNQTIDCATHEQVTLLDPVATHREVLQLFHTVPYVNKIIEQSKFGVGYLDQGDTPAFTGMYEAVCYVAGSVVDAIDQLMKQRFHYAFIPIAGLHHARRDTASGFCVINDCGIAIEYLRQFHAIQRIAYVDIDAHHGDGVFYSYEDDKDLIFADIHEDGKILYPGTGNINETGKGNALGTKLNIPMPAQADDDLFMQVWPKLEAFIDRFKPEFFILQCGADSIAGDPITHLNYSEKTHAFASMRLRQLADKHAQGRLLVLGGGGYKLDNIARTWLSVVQQLCQR